MPKGVKKNKRTRNTKEFITKDEEQHYAQVIKKLGDSRMSIKFTSGQEAIGIIRGTMKKRQWVHLNNWVLVSEREFERDKYDIIHVYNDEEVKLLFKLKEIVLTDTEPQEETSIVWDDIELNDI